MPEKVLELVVFKLAEGTSRERFLEAHRADARGLNRRARGPGAGEPEAVGHLTPPAAR